MRRPRRAPAPLPARLGPIDAPPVAQPAGPQRRGVQGAIGGQLVIGCDDGDGKVVDVWIADPVPVPHSEPCKHREALGVDELVVPYVGTRRETHVTDMPGYDHGDLGGAHVGDGTDRGGDPVVRQVVLVGNLAVLDQQHDGVGEGVFLRAVQPGIVGNPADADLGGIHEIGVALDVGRPAVEIVGNGSPPGSHLVIHELGENGPIVVNDPCEIIAIRIARWSGSGGRRALYGDDVVIAGKRFQGKQAVVKRPVLGSRVK